MAHSGRANVQADDQIMAKHCKSIRQLASNLFEPRHLGQGLNILLVLLDRR